MQQSSYETERLANIAKNEQELLKLGLVDHSMLHREKKTPVKRSQNKRKRVISKADEVAVLTRRSSLRSRNRQINTDTSNASSSTLPYIEAIAEKEVDLGPEVAFEILADCTKEDYEKFIDAYKTNISTSKIDKTTVDMDDNTLKELSLSRAGIKVTPKRIKHVSLHPMSNEDFSLLIAGDTQGNIGCYQFGNNVSDEMKEEGIDVVVYRPCKRSISCIIFDDNENAYFTSHSGVIKRINLKQEQFQDVWDNNSGRSLNYLCFPKINNTYDTFYTCDSDGFMHTIDIRQETTANSVSIHTKKVTCIDTHPINEYLITTSSNDHVVSLWDIRTIKKPLAEENYTRAVSSALFSPSGKYVLSTCYDDTISIISWCDAKGSYNVKDKSKIVTNKIKHYNQTGAWVTNFAAIWGWNDDNIIIGNMRRMLDVYSTSTTNNKKTYDILCSLEHEYLTAIPAVNCINRTQNIIASCSGSGYVYIWR